MNIAYYSHYFTPEIGAPSARIYDLAQQWLSMGHQVQVGTDPDRILSETKRILTHGGKAGRIPKLWDGRSAKRIVNVIARHFALPTTPEVGL